MIGEFARQLASQVVCFGRRLGLASLVGPVLKTDASFDEAWLTECANDLSLNRGRSIVTVGEQQPAWVQTLGLPSIRRSATIGATISERRLMRSRAASISDLAAAIKPVAVKTLFVLGGNPAYNAPADLNFSSLLKKVPQSVRLGLFEDETSKLCRWHVPAAHYLETWSDVRAYDGTYSVIQPMILPLWNGVNELEILAPLAGRPETAGTGTRSRRRFAQTFHGDPTTMELGASSWVCSRQRVAGGARFHFRRSGDERYKEASSHSPKASSLSFSRATAWMMADTPTIHGYRKLPISRPRLPGTMSRSLVPPPPRSSASEPTILVRFTRSRSKFGNHIDFDIVADLIEIKSGGRLDYCGGLRGSRSR